MDPLNCTLDEWSNHNRPRGDQRDSRPPRDRKSRKRRQNPNDYEYQQDFDADRKRRRTYHRQNYNHRYHRGDDYHERDQYQWNHQPHSHYRHQDNYPRHYHDYHDYHDHHQRRNDYHAPRAPIRRGREWRRKEKEPPLPPPPASDYYLRTTSSEQKHVQEEEQKTHKQQQQQTEETKQAPPAKPTEEEQKDTNNDNDAPQPQPQPLQYGFVTLIMRGDAYIPGALILAHSMRLVHTQHPLICMVTNDVSDRAKDALKLLYDHVVQVPYLRYNCKQMKTDKQKEKYKDWASDSFTKWNILQLNELLEPQFERLLFLDSDKIVIQNIDHLLTDPKLQCPAGTFSSPWTTKHNTNSKGLIDHYPQNMTHGDEIAAKCIYNALYRNGFVAVGTGMLFNPSIADYRKYVKMLDRRWISDEQFNNNVDLEVDEETEDNPKDTKKTIGFRNCYSMLDEQSIVFFYFYHKRPWYYIDTKYNFIPWHFNWLENEHGELEIPAVLHFFSMKPWDQSPNAWHDLQVWWGLVYNLVNYARTTLYDSWGEEEVELVSSFFKLQFLKELPLDLFVRDNDSDDQTDKKDGKEETEEEKNDKDKDAEKEKEKQKEKAKVICFWCCEIAKRSGLDTSALIKEGKYDEAEQVFHFPVDLKTGRLCCPKLSKYGADSETTNVATTEGDGDTVN